MTRSEVVKFYGSQTKAAHALGITPQAVNKWPSEGDLPAMIAYRVEVVSGGALKANQPNPCYCHACGKEL